ncbi:VSP [Giardia duodenalis]|uniref:VSP n=1 Tax=Giardia intestinalis (strain ATCC 50803 / WB clone C6) TaxID=184922 RepID=A8BEA2_GIAIC|nr:VSP [Giardia intestinalis]KAE8305807.1 VSP [Giardia intestinalis]|eukprot:XP_001707624.1 VSP [Giardia lamblia ATCC 50803]
MLLIALHLVTSILAAPCQPDGDHAASCQTDKCETVGYSEICTECRAGGVPVGGFCWPPGTPQAAAAGCTRADGTALAGSDTICGKCGDGYFLFMGGCYKTSQWSEICTAADKGVCTTCKAGAAYLFQNPASPVAPGNECVLCSDVAPRDGVTGVAGCYTCTAPGGGTGAATCTACQGGYAKKGDACVQCGPGCLTCESATPTQCTACPKGKFLKGTECVEASGCGSDSYADPKVDKCKACATDIADCATCEYNATISQPQCKTCSSSKIVKTAADGTTTCVAEGECTSTHFIDQTPPKACVLCGDDARGGVAGCSSCPGKDQCSACLAGYIKKGSGNSVTCDPCGENCATCTQAGNDKCDTCKPGYFLKQPGSAGKCFACDSKADNGIEGCSQCNSGLTPTCTDCKSNYRKEGTNPVKCTKVCEDPTACGGTSGACGAVVVDSAGAFSQYCSLCGDPATFPIDGVCTGTKGDNTCENGVCTRCAAGFFLYMGGCYDVSKAPGSHMCKTAEGGRCTAPSENGRYFLVPGASNTDQSVLACENPLGTVIGAGSTAKAYVGVYGCTACTAPAALEAPGMTPATCTACSGNNKPNLAGSGCFTCTVDGCSHCGAGGKCEACTSKDQRPNTDGSQCIACSIDGCVRCSEENKCGRCGDDYRLEGEACVSTKPSGGNRSGLSTGAIAGISVAVVVVVAGLVGFLCWWFICRGKA